MDESKAYQEDHKVVYGLLGRVLGHSHSPEIHKMLAGYEYGLFEREPEQLADFLQNPQFKGINVTIPYKRDVMPYCAELSETAKRCNSVNTIVAREDGSLAGYNTDYAGFTYTVKKSGCDVAGKKALVFGSGGVSGTVVTALRDMGGDPVVIISRSGEDNYTNLDRHRDAKILVNTTPVGMNPHEGEAVVDVRDFPQCECIFDLIYNPLRTKIMLDGERAGLPAYGGLAMLVAQAAKAAELFTGTKIGDEVIDDNLCRLQQSLENLVLIGMPGCGKTSIGRQLAKMTGRTFVDIDEEITASTGRSPEQIIREEGNEAFRIIETECLRNVLRKGIIHSANTSDGQTLVVATGGGCVEREENYELLRENSEVIFLQRPLQDLPTDGRPISQSDGLQAIYDRRIDKYQSWSDLQIDVIGPKATAEQITSCLYGAQQRG